MRVERWIGARFWRPWSAPARCCPPRRTRAPTTSTPASSARTSTATTRGSPVNRRRRVERRPLHAPDTTCASPGDPLVAACFSRGATYAPGVVGRARVLRAAETRDHRLHALNLRQLYTRGRAERRTPNTPVRHDERSARLRLHARRQLRRGRHRLRHRRPALLGRRGPIDKTVTLSKADSPHSSGDAGHRRGDGAPCRLLGGRTAVCSLGASDACPDSSSSAPRSRSRTRVPP